MRTAVFGGTFNPPHLGHINLARAVIAGRYAEKVLFVPAYRPPHKTNVESAPFPDRVQMLMLALQNFEEAEISTLEEQRPEALSYTFDTLAALAVMDQDTELVLLIGEDSLDQLHTWHRAQDLAELYKIITYPRRGCMVDIDHLRRLWPEHLAVKLALSKTDLPIYDISSTAIRQALHRGESPEGVLDPDVLKYIEEKQLYR